MKLKTLWLGLPLGIVLIGCNVGPDYKPPKMDVPAEWAELNAAGPSARPTTQPTTQPAVTAQWWKTLNDPTLDSLIERSLKSNHELKIAASRIREARALRRIVLSGEFPSVGVGASYTRTQISENSGIGGVFAGAAGANTGGGFPAIAPDLYQVGFDASWEIDVFGGVRRQIEAADADIQATQENQRDVMISLMGEVAANYIDLRGLQRQIEISHQNLETQQASLVLIRDRARLGITGDLDPARANAQVANTKAQIPALEGAAQRAIHRISVLTGQAPGALVPELATPRPIPGLPPVIPVGLPSDLLLRRPDIRRAERQLAAANARIGAATANLYPRFALNGNVGLQASQFARIGDWNSSFWNFGPSISLPLFDRGKLYANIKVQNEREQQALQAYESTVLRAFAEVEGALVGYSKQQIRRQYLEESVQANRKALELVQFQFRGGLIGFLDVLDAQRSLYLAEEQLVGSEREVASNLVALYKALGGGWEQQDMGNEKR